MNEQLLLSHVRSVLARLEETILFSFIERAQFRHNETIYRPGAFGEPAGRDSLVGYLLHETEKTHSLMRRYTSPDEHPFYSGLPAPLLPALAYRENPLRERERVNVNALLRDAYEREIVPLLCRAGDDSQYGSSSVCDVACLQALSRRIHYGKFVAESKFAQNTSVLAPLIAAGDRMGLTAAITDLAMEREVLRRVARKTRTYTQELPEDAPDRQVPPEAMTRIYADWIIPLNKEVQVLYLLQRGSEAATGNGRRK